MKYFIFFCGFFNYFFAKAQETIIYHLPEVRIETPFSPSQFFINSHSFSDTLVYKYNGNAVDVLRNELNVYLKQYGSGLLATSAMRGASASHTGVYWNGIPMNSILNGQTDFNTFSLQTYSSIIVKKGGGSILLGGGAMGGVLYLRDHFNIPNGFGGKLNASVGSFNYYKGGMQLHYKNKQHRFIMNGQGILAENDYIFPTYNKKNDNAQYNNQQLKMSYQFTANKTDKFQAFFNHQIANRNLGNTLYVAAQDSLQVQNIGGIVSWIHQKGNYYTELKGAFTHEVYNYFYNRENPSHHALHKADNFFLHQQNSWKLPNNSMLKVGFSLSKSIAKSSNLVADPLDKAGIYISFLGGKPKLKYQVGVRKDFSSLFRVPLVVNSEVAFEPSQKWKFSGTFSTNFREPTLNDLYWNPGGNSDLLPENNVSGDVNMNFHNKSWQVKVSGFHTLTKNMIQWRPKESGIWSPVNIGQVEVWGVESSVSFEQTVHTNQFEVGAQHTLNYATDIATGYQLMYVPVHFAHINMTWTKPYFSLELIENLSGKVYSTSDESDFVMAYAVTDLHLSSGKLLNHVEIGFFAKNIFNQAYEFMPTRLMPGRNFEVSLQYTF